MSRSSACCPQRLQVATELRHHVIKRKKRPVHAVRELTSGAGENIVSARRTRKPLSPGAEMSARYRQLLYFRGDHAGQTDAGSRHRALQRDEKYSSYDSTTAFFEQALRAMSLGLIKSTLSSRTNHWMMRKRR
jgi:hypothetical protein